MFWLGYDHYVVQEAEIGSRNKHSDNADGTDAYCANIRRVMEQVQRKLVPGGLCCVVIGDAIFKDRLIRMDTIYREILGQAGFACNEAVSFDQRKYTKAFTPNTKTGEKRSYIMIFEKR